MSASVPLSKQTLQRLGSRQADETPLFPSLPSEPTVNKELRRIASSVGLNRLDVTFYCARHTFVCLQLENGRQPHEIQPMTGHASVNALMRYARSLEQDNPQLALDI
jgi:integrase